MGVPGTTQESRPQRHRAPTKSCVRSKKGRCGVRKTHRESGAAGVTDCGSASDGTAGFPPGGFSRASFLEELAVLGPPASLAETQHAGPGVDGRTGQRPGALGDQGAPARSPGHRAAVPVAPARAALRHRLCRTVPGAHGGVPLTEWDAVRCSAPPAAIRSAEAAAVPTPRRATSSGAVAFTSGFKMASSSLISASVKGH